MTQEEKNLLLDDLCGRIPYGVKVIEFDVIIQTLRSIEYVGNGNYYVNPIHDGYGQVYPLCAKIEYVKLFLRPMDTMTEEERNEFQKKTVTMRWEEGPIITKEAEKWLRAKHFDYNNLIPKGLALPAKEGMYDKE